jgi:histidinol-phosphate/aromatic aminotransferase/cobyric acid decarboxylase-like protein
MTTGTRPQPEIASREEWLAARKQLLVGEKEHTRLGDELARRRRENAEGLAQLEQIMRERGLEPAGPAVGNFLFAEVGEDSRGLFEQLLREGVIVRPTAGFGALGAIRVTVGTPEENELFGEALGRVLSPTTPT